MNSPWEYVRLGAIRYHIENNMPVSAAVLITGYVDHVLDRLKGRP